MSKDEQLRADIERVMRETGMEYMQAYNHIRCRELLRKQSERRKADLPWGRLGNYPTLEEV